MKTGTLAIAILAGLPLAGCLTVPVPGDIDMAEVFHWENEYATMGKFVQDHKTCLGVTQHTQHKSRMKTLVNPMDPMTMPQWDGMWATFESREYKEGGQRIAVSIPSNSSAALSAQYKPCMLAKNYRLTYKR